MLRKLVCVLLSATVIPVSLWADETITGKVISSRAGGRDNNGQLEYSVQLRQGLYFIKITSDCRNEFLKLNIH